MYLKRLPRKRKKKLDDIKKYHSDRYKFKLNEAIKNGTMIISFENDELKSTFPCTLKARQNAIPAQKWYEKKMEELKQKMIITQIALLTPSV